MKMLDSRILVLCLALPLQSWAGQFINGDFNDAQAFGNYNNWQNNDTCTNPFPCSIGFASPGQTGGGSTIILNADNNNTETFIAQDVAVSGGAFVPYLEFWYVAQNADGNVSNSGQRVQVRDTGNTPLDTVLNISANNAFGWVQQRHNLSAHVGQTRRFHFAARGSVSGGSAKLYLDSISINYATYTPTNTPTPTQTRSFTRSPTYTATLTRTPTPTATATPTYQPPTQVQNGDFEILSGGASPFASWTKEAGTVTAANIGEWIASFQSFSGVPLSGLYQVIHVANVGSPQLVFSYQPNQGSGATGTDAQFFELRNPATKAVLASPLLVSQNHGNWTQVSYDLGPWVGQNLELFLGTRSSSGVNTANFNNVGILYGTYTPTPSRTATPTATPSATGTPTFTATPSGTPSATASPSASPTASPTRTATRTATPSATPTASATASPTATPTPSITVTFTHSPTGTISPTFTASPPFAVSKVGKAAVGPVPARVGDPVCLYFEQAPARSEWLLYNSAGELSARLVFGLEVGHCLATGTLAPGIYYLKLKIGYADGSSRVETQKIVLVK